MHAVERTTTLFTDTVERHPAALVGITAAASSTVLGIADGLTASTAAASAIATATVALVTLVVRVLLADIRGLRARVQTLEQREDARLAAITDERAAMQARIADLERRLLDDGR